MKTRIAVDVDQVLAMTFDRVVDAMNAEFGTDVSPAEVDDWNVADFWAKRCDFEPDLIAEAFDDIFHSEELLDTAAVNLPMVTVMRRLAGWSSDPNGPIVITARPPGLAQTTRLWLQEYGLPFSRLVHTPDKATYCREHKIRYILEDSPHQAVACHGVGVGVFLFDYPWNRHVEATGDNGIWRIHHPAAIPELLWSDLVAVSK